MFLFVGVFEFHAQNLVNQLAGGEIGGLVDVVRAELHDVQPDDVVALVDEAQEIQHLPVVKPVRLRSPRGGHDGGVEHVEVDGDVHVVVQFLGHHIHPVVAFFGVVQLVGVEDAVRHDVFFLLRGRAADSHLRHGGDFLGAGHDAGVVVRAALVLRTHVGMGVELEHGEFLVVLGERPKRADAH